MPTISQKTSIFQFLAYFHSHFLRPDIISLLFLSFIYKILVFFFSYLLD